MITVCGSLTRITMREFWKDAQEFFYDQLPSWGAICNSR